MPDQCSDMGKTARKKAPKPWVLISAIAVGIAVLCLAIGIPTKDDKKIGMRDLATLVMPFNFAYDKFSEFKYFTETIHQKWGTTPEELLKLHDYNDPDDYGHSAYAVEDADLVVEFYYFENGLYESIISLKDSVEANSWVEYLETKFGKLKTDGAFSYWDRDQMRIVYATDSELHSFYFVHLETFIAAQEYRKSVDSSLTRLIEFKQVVDNRVRWNTSPESLPNISLYQKKDLYQWDIYTHNNVKNLDYHFFRNKLCGIDFFFVRNYGEAQKMVGILTAKLGEGENHGANGRKWEAKGVTIISTQSSPARSFLFRYNETWAEKEKYEKKYALSTP